jgi:hypothetical protein
VVEIKGIVISRLYEIVAILIVVAFILFLIFVVLKPQGAELFERLKFLIGA